MTDKQTISISVEVREYLRGLKITPGETYDQVIRRLIKHTNKEFQDIKKKFEESTDLNEVQQWTMNRESGMKE